MKDMDPYVRLLNDIITLLHTQLNRNSATAGQLNNVLMQLQDAVIKLESVLNKES